MSEDIKSPLSTIVDGLHEFRMALAENRLSAPDAIVFTDRKTIGELKNIIRHDMQVIGSAVEVGYAPHSRTYVCTILGIEIHAGVEVEE